MFTVVDLPKPCFYLRAVSLLKDTFGSRLSYVVRDRRDIACAFLFCREMDVRRLLILEAQRQIYSTKERNMGLRNARSVIEKSFN